MPDKRGMDQFWFFMLNIFIYVATSHSSPCLSSNYPLEHRPEKVKFTATQRSPAKSRCNVNVNAKGSNTRPWGDILWLFLRVFLEFLLTFLFQFWQQKSSFEVPKSACHILVYIYWWGHFSCSSRAAYYDCYKLLLQLCHFLYCDWVYFWFRFHILGLLLF